MRAISLCLFLLSGICTYVHGQAPTLPVSTLNRSVEFINHSVDQVERMITALKSHYEYVQYWKAKNNTFVKSLTPSGAMEEYYYKKALEKQPGVSVSDTKELHSRTQAVWQAMQQLDNTYKSLEVYLRLGDYKTDQFQKSEALIVRFQQQLVSFRQEKEQLFSLVQRIYQTSKASQAENAYVAASKPMLARLKSEEELLSLWSYNFHEATPTGWPIEKIQNHVNATDLLLKQFAKSPDNIKYPASSAYTGFGAALSSLQEVKRNGIDQYNHQARQSDRHGNEVYQNLINYYNNDLLSTYNQFVSYSNQQLLLKPKFCPLFEIRTSAQAPTVARPTFQDTPIPPLKVTEQKAAISETAFTALDRYVEFINESVRGIQYLQLTLRNYQSSANYYKPLTSFEKRGGLEYSHKDFKIPQSVYQQALQGTTTLPETYRKPLQEQVETLFRIQQEMDALSIELSAYTTEKRYEKDRFARHDELVNRYAMLFDAFDKRKDRLYEDVRNVFESYPAAQPKSSWYVSGKSLLQTFDEDKTALFGVKGLLTGKEKAIPNTTAIELGARTLIEKEYQHMEGLKRYGRNNGLCPYTPYEDLAENSRRFSERIKAIKPIDLAKTSKAYEDFIYFYNNNVVYPYNKFCELAQVKLLKQINQPFLFVLTQPESGEKATTAPTTKPLNQEVAPTPTLTETPKTSQPKVIHDTVYVEKNRIDTVYIPVPADNANLWSMEGYAYNNLVLLLDVSGSMNAPHKLPLLKKSVKRLLEILRAEDEIAIVIYSGKAKVLMEPTSGKEIEKITRIIDQLESDGNTDGNAGVKLAYKVADKNYIRGGNNRIILATDGEFAISPEVFELVQKSAKEDIHLTIFDFQSATANRSKVRILQKLAETGKGSFEMIAPHNSDLKLVQEAKAKRIK